MKTILAPVDFSAVTKQVVTEAAALARVHGGRLVLINVTQPVTVMADYTAFLENIAEVNDLVARAASRELAAIRKGLTGILRRVEVVQRTGSPVALILEEARACGADVIVIGSHGHTALHDLLVGGTASGVLKHAPCPVLVVPPVRPRRPAGRKRRGAAAT
jgi:nucleotide-binding universal stress UspA family protein